MKVIFHTSECEIEAGNQSRLRGATRGGLPVNASITPYCRFRDCTKEAQPGQLFCRFHAGDEFALDADSLGSIRAVERTFRQQPEHSDTARYGLALATVLTKWFGDEAKLVVAECTRILGSMR